MHKSLDLIIPVYNSHDALVKALASVAVNDIDFKLKVYIVMMVLVRDIRKRQKYLKIYLILLYLI